MTDPYEAFRFDRAVYYFGSTLEAELDRQEAKTAVETQKKRERVFAKWMGNNSSSARKFRDPAAR